MVLNTKNFGEVEIKDEDIILFEYGIPGFEAMTKFVILGKTDAVDDPFFWLQSIQNPYLKPSAYIPIRVQPCIYVLFYPRVLWV